MAVLTVGLTTVRSEFNAVFPHRDKSSDGWIGDSRHAAGTSGHNPESSGHAEYDDHDGLDEVRAIDVDRDLVAGSVDWMEIVVQYLVKRARAGFWIPFRYIIYKRRIWAKTDGWKTRVYTGVNKHDEHAHFSGDRSQRADNFRGSLALASLLGEDDMDFTNSFTLTADAAAATGRAAQSPLKLETALNLLLIYTARTSRQQLPALLDAAGADPVDEAQVANLVLAGLDPAAIAAAVAAAVPADQAKQVADEIYARMAGR